MKNNLKKNHSKLQVLFDERRNLYNRQPDYVDENTISATNVFLLSIK